MHKLIFSIIYCIHIITTRGLPQSHHHFECTRTVLSTSNNRTLAFQLDTERSSSVVKHRSLSESERNSYSLSVSEAPIPHHRADAFCVQLKSVSTRSK